MSSAFTHKAKKHLTDGMTLHKMFGFDINGKRSHKTNFTKVDVVIVDEVSMMSTMFYDALISLKKTNPKIKFILCGDFNQLQPVGEEHISFLNLRVIFDLCPNKLLLKINKRIKDNGQEFYEVMEKALNGEEFKLPTTEKPLDINLCYTNKTRKIINRKMMLKKRGDNFKTMVRNPEYIKLKTYGNSQTMYLYEGLPILCKGGKNLDDLTNGDLLTVESYDDKEVIMKRSDDTIHTVKLNDLFIFTFFPAYCLTIHSAQGDTIDRPYAIYDMERFPSVNMTYTALSRSTKLSNIFQGSLTGRPNGERCSAVINSTRTRLIGTLKNKNEIKVKLTNEDKSVEQIKKRFIYKHYDPDYNHTFYNSFDYTTEEELNEFIQKRKNITHQL